MKLNFKKVGDLLCPTGPVGQLVEDVLKCTVTSSPEQETVMTLTVMVSGGQHHLKPGPGGIDKIPHTDQITWECELMDCEDRNPNCVHVGSKPRLCVVRRNKQVEWGR